jgi:hypothetical protein
VKVVLVVDIQGLKDKKIFDKHLKKEGFLPVENEDFAYEGEAHTHLYNTRAYIMDVVSKGLEKSGFDTCKLMFQVGENPMETYAYNHKEKNFS